MSRFNDREFYDQGEYYISTLCRLLQTKRGWSKRSGPVHILSQVRVSSSVSRMQIRPYPAVFTGEGIKQINRMLSSQVAMYNNRTATVSSTIGSKVILKHVPSRKGFGGGDHGTGLDMSTIIEMVSSSPTEEQCSG